jgi:hypothetical protein
MSYEYRLPNYDSYLEPREDDGSNEDHEEQCRCDSCGDPLEDGTQAYRHVELIADATDHDGPETAVLWVCSDCATPEERRAAREARAAKKDADRAKARDRWREAGFIDDDLPF